MSLLIGSVYVDHPRSQTWYKLQTQFLKRTTKDYEHVIYLNGKNYNFYTESKVLEVNSEPAETAQLGHSRGLNAIIDHFNNHEEFDDLLLLDSDCFPFRIRWQEDLTSAMEDKFGVAAIVRYENLDTFAHPSFFYVTRDKTKDLKFGHNPNTNMVGFEFDDTSSNSTDPFFPLVRTNRLNYHPVLCGVYWNRFYHHGAGSRSLEFRLFYHYFNENNNVSSLEEKLFEELVDDPHKFMKKISLPAFARKMY